MCHKKYGSTLDEVEKSNFEVARFIKNASHAKYEFWFIVKHSHISNTKNCSLVMKFISVEVAVNLCSPMLHCFWENWHM